MITEDGINALIDQAINALTDDNAEHGAEALVELAHYWAKAGLTQKSFADMRHYIIRSAIERLGKSATAFIHMKVMVAEQQLKKQRFTSGANNGTIIIRH